jgi:negative regulator of sigma-B (phosphoserine phosphatase)
VSEEVSPLIEWAVAHSALPGQKESGDLYLVHAFDGGTLVAAIDGLGHGPEAAVAAQRAADTLERHHAEPVSSLLERCHTNLRGTRGAVITLASFDGRRNTMSWVGVGNIEGTLVRAEPREDRRRESVMLVGGVPGHQLPQLRSAELPVSPGDTLVLSTDGIRPGYLELLASGDPPNSIVERIMDQFGKGTDDALVLVARYLGMA